MGQKSKLNIDCYYKCIYPASVQIIGVVYNHKMNCVRVLFFCLACDFVKQYFVVMEVNSICLSGVSNTLSNIKVCVICQMSISDGNVRKINVDLLFPKVQVVICATRV